MDKKYIKRLIENELVRKLNSSGCVLVTGPKFCGKSTMCSQYAKSAVALNNTSAIELANADPKGTLLGEQPRLIDEWQKAPEIWNEIKSDLDKDYEFGKYLLTGSTTPVNESKIQHSGAGRITTIALKPFSLYESGESSGVVSLHEIANGRFPETVFATETKTTLRDIAFLLCRGGWPISVKAKREYALDVTTNYFEGLFNIENESDEFADFLKKKDINLLTAILRSYARNVSSQCKRTQMIKDVLESGLRSTLDDETFNKYSEVLKKLYIIYDMPSWNFNLRSSATIRLSATHHFVDTSIATAALGIRPENLLNDMHSFGLFFEDFAIRDLSIYALANHATIKHYRDSSGKEVDAVIEFENGEYGLIEIKIASENNIKAGIKSLTQVEKAIVNSGFKKPMFKMILTSHGACYVKDGISIVPITMLRD